MYDKFFNRQDSPLNNPVRQSGISFDANYQVQTKHIQTTSINSNTFSVGTMTTDTINGTTLVINEVTAGTGVFSNKVSSPFITGTMTAYTVNGEGTLAGTLNSTGIISNGTINNPTIGTPTITGGTVNAGSYEVLGSAGASGSIVYVKTVNFAGSTTTLGTVQFLNGIVTSIT